MGKLFKGGNYTRKYCIHMVLWDFLAKIAAKKGQSI